MSEILKMIAAVIGGLIIATVFKLIATDEPEWTGVMMAMIMSAILHASIVSINDSKGD